MSVLVHDPDFELHVGDALEALTTLPDGSVDCVVTSPPYWGLRDYGTGAWEGGDPNCDHIGGTLGRQDAGRNFTGGGGNREGSGNPGKQQFRDVCGKCGATRQDRQLGLEATPDEYVTNMVAVFREVRRVLADHGSLWLNLGDSYASGGSGWVTDARTVDTGETSTSTSPNYPKDAPVQDALAARSFRAGSGRADGKVDQRGQRNRNGTPPVPSLKPKDLVGVPWRVAFALQADGWYLRSDIIWSKPNPMPESVTDRPTKAHEYVFLLSKGPRYFFDQEAVREQDGGKPSGNGFVRPHRLSYGDRGNEAQWEPGGGRNVRSVWEIATRPFSEAHFATYPPELVRRCILAGCPEGGTVLDPFLGSGTTALVAREHGRRCVGIELNPDYARMAARRLGQLSLLA